MTQLKLNKLTYICQLPEAIQIKVINKVTKSFKMLGLTNEEIKEEIELIKNSRLADVEELTNVSELL